MSATATATATVFIKNMTGDVLPLNVSCHATLLDISRALSDYDPHNYPFHETAVVAFVERDYLLDGDTFAIIVNRSEYLLNHTPGTYVETYQHNHTMRYLTRPLAQGALLSADSGHSHWSPEDHIVFVPQHLKSYVAHHYARLDIRV